MAKILDERSKLLGMICPKCRAEYRPGFTVCADCGVALVEAAGLAMTKRGERGRFDGAGRERAPDAGEESGEQEFAAAEPDVAGAPGDPNEDPFCSFWKGTDLRICTEICTVLDEAGIPHKTIRRQDHLFNFNHQSPYEVGVPASLYEKAELAIKEAFATEGEAGEAIAMLNQQNRESFERLVNQPIEEKLKQRPEEEIPGFLESLSKLGGWIRKYDDNARQMGRTAAAEREFFPEDATSLAWGGEPAEARETIEMSLKENDVWTRWELLGGKPQLFVLPEDEERAKEIVREVVEGKPLE